VKITVFRDVVLVVVKLGCNSDYIASDYGLVNGELVSKLVDVKLI
jgi:hypothetical protein